MGAAFTGADRIDGGGGHGNVVVLDGDYSAGIEIAGGSLSNIWSVRLETGHSYALTVTAAGAPYIDGLLLGAGDSLRLDGSMTTDGLYADGGAGDDLLAGGSGDDLFYGRYGRNTLIGGGGSDTLVLQGSRDVAKGGAGDDQFRIDTTSAGTEHDRINGGAGEDSLTITSGGTLVFDDASLRNVERLFINTGPTDLTFADGNVAADQVLEITVSGPGIRIDGSLETDGAFNVTTIDNIQMSTLIGGAGDDTLGGGSVGDLIVGGAGDDRLSTGDVAGTVDDAWDTVIGGLGQDRIFTLRGGNAAHFVYQQLADSTAAAPDLISGLDNRHDVIDLSAIDADAGQAGDQAFHLVSSFSGQAGELTLHYDAASKITQVAGDVDGDGTADLVIELKGDHSGFTGFAL
jgi:Ca2+-binding RTX toxin-like protein